MTAAFLHPPFTILHYDSLPSTNDHLKQLTDAPEFTCVTATMQTAGRGRRERVWHSTPGDGLYLSVLLRPLIPARQIPLLSLMAAVAVAEAVTAAARGIARKDLDVDIKWPNDVLAGGRKLSGVLIESVSAANEAPRVVVGIGVNLNHQSFPPELSGVATSLAIECGARFAVEEFRGLLLDALARWYEVLGGGGAARLLRRWQELSSYARGKQVVVRLDDKELRGVTEGLTESGALLVRAESGELHTVLAGEVVGLREGTRD
jgi:BirA family transcriptional regulator, biotin operon repressor / biotin---[acetyl-CoA-carboxylase] ligase